MYKVTRWTYAIFHHHMLFFDSEHLINKKNSVDLACSVTEIGKVTYKWHDFDLTLNWEVTGKGHDVALYLFLFRNQRHTK